MGFKPNGLPALTVLSLSLLAGCSSKANRKEALLYQGYDMALPTTIREAVHDSYIPEGKTYVTLETVRNVYARIDLAKIEECRELFAYKGYMGFYRDSEAAEAKMEHDRKKAELGVLFDQNLSKLRNFADPFNKNLNYKKIFDGFYVYEDLRASQRQELWSKRGYLEQKIVEIPLGRYNFPQGIRGVNKFLDLVLESVCKMSLEEKEEVLEEILNGVQDSP